MKFFIRFVHSFFVVLTYGPDNVLSAMTYDTLTGLYARRYIEEIGQKAVAQCLRYGREISLAVIDLDDLKEVNDSRGHAAGDRLLECFGIFCRQNMRSADSIGRIGGDEFLFVLPETNAKAAGCILARFQRTCCAANVRFSFGVASGKRGDTFGTLRALADKAMYQNKGARAGR